MPYTPINYDEYYDSIGNARKMALDAALLNQQQQLSAQDNALKGQYDDMRGQVYTGNRVSALGNNERMASLGLAGNAYAGPQSGYSETSRVTQDTAMQSALNAATRQQQGARDALSMQGNAAMLSRDQQLAGAMADLEAQKVSANTQQNQFMANLDAQNAALAESQRQYDATTAASQEQFKIQQQQASQAAALAKAQAELQIFGKVMTKETAAILGVPVGTKMRR